MKRKDLLGIKELDAEEILSLVEEGLKIKAVLRAGKKKFPDLTGRSAVTLFYENSTRTRCSFDLAAKNLGMDVVNLGVANSSVQKGETLIDTGKTLDRQQNDFIVIRHPAAGAPRLLARNVKAHVINAGDGMNEHPSQALLDALTAKRRFGDIAGLKIVIVGDIYHSRVARSDTLCFTKLGASVTLCAPYSLMPDGIESMGATVETDLKKAVVGANVVMPLRIQRERMEGAYFPSVEEYHRYYGVTDDIVALAGDAAAVMHPAPINRGAEITGEVADGYKSVIQEQVKNGVAVRMALLSLLVKCRLNK